MPKKSRNLVLVYSYNRFFAINGNLPKVIYYVIHINAIFKSSYAMGILYSTKNRFAKKFE